MKEHGLLDDEEEARLKAEAEQQVREAAAWAEAQPDPDPATVAAHVYAEGGRGGWPLKTSSNRCATRFSRPWRQDERVMILGEDVGRHGGVFNATKGFTTEFGEDRVVDTPLAESSIVGIAIGAAVGGLLPVAEIQFADFIHPAVDQIINEAAKIRYRSNNDFGCPIVIRAPYGGGIHGGLYHSQNIEALFFSTPGLKIVAPTTPADVKGLLHAAIRDPDPVLFLEHKLSYRTIKGEYPEGEYVLPIGVADVKREGKDVTVVSYGMTMHYALQAADELAEEGIDVEVIDLRTLLPLDREMHRRVGPKDGKALGRPRRQLDGRCGGRSGRHGRGRGLYVLGRTDQTARGA